MRQKDPKHEVNTNLLPGLPFPQPGQSLKKVVLRVTPFHSLDLIADDLIRGYSGSLNAPQRIVAAQQGPNHCPSVDIIIPNKGLTMVELEGSTRHKNF